MTTELETLLLGQLQQQQQESERLLRELFLQLGNLQIVLNDQQREAAELRQELARSDQENMALITNLTKRVGQLTQLLDGLVKPSIG